MYVHSDLKPVCRKEFCNVREIKGPPYTTSVFVWIRKLLRKCERDIIACFLIQKEDRDKNLSRFHICEPLVQLIEYMYIVKGFAASSYVIQYFTYWCTELG